MSVVLNLRVCFCYNRNTDMERKGLSRLEITKKSTEAEGKNATDATSKAKKQEVMSDVAKAGKRYHIMLSRLSK